MLTSQIEETIMRMIASGPVNIREIAAELYKARKLGSIDECVYYVRRFAFIHRRLGVSSGFCVKYTRTGKTEAISLSR